MKQSIDKLFIYSSEEDVGQLEKLLRHLNPLLENWRIDLSHAGNMPSDKKSAAELLDAISQSDIVLFLVSSNLLNETNYQRTIKNAQVLQRPKKVIPIIIGACLWREDSLLKNCIPLPMDGSPLQMKYKQLSDKSCVQVVKSIGALVGKDASLYGRIRSSFSIDKKGSEDYPYSKQSKRITFWGVLTAIALVAGLYADIPGLAGGIHDFFYPKNNGVGAVAKTIIEPSFHHSQDGDALFSPSDSAFTILITRFEDYIADSETECIGRSLFTNLENIRVNRKIEIHPIYADNILSPYTPEAAQELQRYHNADLLLYGLANQVKPNCVGANVCFRHMIADTIMGNIEVPDTMVSRVTNKINHRLDYIETRPEKLELQESNPFSLRERKLSLNDRGLQAWLESLIALKLDNRERSIFYIDKMAGQDLSEISQDEQVEQYFNRGKAYMTLHRYNEALKDFHKVVEIDSTYAEAYLQRANCSFAMSHRNGDKEIALKDFSKAILLDPNNARIYHDRGRCYEAMRYFKAALDDFTQAIKIESSEPLFYAARANCYRKSSGNFRPSEKGLHDLTRAIALDPNNEIQYIERGEYYRILNHDTNAIRDYSKAISLKPDDPDLYSERGNYYEELELVRKAIQDFTKIIDLSPNKAISYLRRGNYYKNLCLEEEALADYARLIELDSTNNTNYSRRAAYLIELNRIEEALKDFDKLVELSPSTAHHYISRADCYRLLNRNYDALRDYDIAIRLKPKLREYYVKRADLHGNIGNVTEALKDYSSIIDLPAELNSYRGLWGDPSKSDDYYLRAEYYRSMGLHEEALQDYKRVIDLDPGLASSYFKRGVYHKELQRDSSELVDYNKAIELSPNNVKYYIARGDYFKRLAKPVNAIQDYTKAIEISPENLSLYIKRGDYYNQLGQFQDAVDDYTSIIKIKPKYIDAYKVRGSMYKKMDKSENVIEDYSSVVRLDHKRPGRYFTRGRYYEEIDESNLAYDDYLKFLSSLPAELDGFDDSEVIKKVISLSERQIGSTDKLSKGEIIKACYVAAKSNQALKNYDRALLYYDRITSIAPTDPGHFRQRVAMLTQAGRHRQCIKDYSSIIALEPDNATNYYHRATTYWILKKYKKALADLSAATKLQGDYTDAHFMMGRVYTTLGKYENALECLSNAIDLRPDAPGFHLRRGIVYYKKGNYNAAEVDFNKSIALESDYSNAYHWRGMLSHRLGSYGQAIMDYSAAMNYRSKPSANTYNKRGLSFYRLNEYRRAASDFKKSFSLGTTERELRYAGVNYCWVLIAGIYPVHIIFLGCVIIFVGIYHRKQGVRNLLKSIKVVRNSVLSSIAHLKK